MGRSASIRAEDGARESERESLRQRVAELDRSLEQALVTAEDAQEEARLLAADRLQFEEEMTAQRREIATLRERLTASETHRAELLDALADSDQRLNTLRQGETHLSEELQTSYEELQVLTEELEEANADLEQRVEERTAQLAESERRFRTLFEAMDEGFLLAEVLFEGDRPADVLYLEMNPAAQRMTGEDFVGRRLREISPAFEDHWYEVFGRAARDGESTRTELYAGPLEKWISFYVFKVGAPDQRRIAVIFRDVTERKRTQEQLKRAKETAEAANRAKTKFLAAASHDLRQPIQAAALYAHVLLGSVGADPVAQESLNRLKASIDSLNGMLSGLLDLSRLEAGVIEVSVTDFSPTALMTRLAEEFRGVAEASSIELRCRPGRLAVCTDPHLLERMLRNLLSNAIAHGRPKGTDARGTDAKGKDAKGRVLLGCRHRADGVEFQVWDNGPGIPEDARGAIFEEFRQLNNPERNGTQGFGLGLSIVSRIAHLLGTEVTLRSRVGAGSVFSVTVPYARQTDTGAAAVPAVGREPRLKGRTVLLVEDDEQVRRSMTMLLKRWGLRVVAVSSAGELAATLPSLRRPHVVLTDYRLPGGDSGRSVVELVRQRWPVPGIIITGDTAPERLREAMSLGCRLLHKPVLPADLAGALDEVLPS
ncbi:PAS domain S-box-containing protein [Azospirillum sp. OGB3]|uniref:ATP-binding response regulator n=1 Tax=Azospirillum sp. OGB3 TaxID=2587012 RepID=UPI001606934A|nr:ATP-binding protein [Azospirillum sp. OGB3]MBB3266896.1 PAS domain S-box-containing protein [Azospirillum sp. OGB3]